MGFVSGAFPVLSPGAEAFWLIAKDQDQDPLTYGISGSYAYFFTVIATTGEVKLASPLDYEVKDSSLRKPRNGDRGHGEPWEPASGVVGGCPVCALTLSGGLTWDPSLRLLQTLDVFSVTISVNDGFNSVS